ncbi:MAG: GntR family transcriptional regulator [Gemmatimonadota bacterium]
MLLDLSDQSAETLQQQIARQVRSRILSGEQPAGAQLPSIRGMARQLRVSVITVSRAYEQLVREGLIRSRRGKGHYVSVITQKGKMDMALERFAEQLQALVAAALDEGLTATAVRHALETALGRRRGETRGEDR